MRHEHTHKQTTFTCAHAEHCAELLTSNRLIEKHDRHFDHRICHRHSGQTVRNSGTNGRTHALCSRRSQIACKYLMTTITASARAAFSRTHTHAHIELRLAVPTVFSAANNAPHNAGHHDNNHESGWPHDRRHRFGTFRTHIVSNDGIFNSLEISTLF